MAHLPMTRKRKRLCLTLLPYVCLALICCLYGGLIAYCCVAAPVDTNNIVPVTHQTGQETNMTDPMGRVDNLGSEFYLSQITSFYQNLIAWLFAIIGVILVVNFVYIVFSSRRQAEDMAEQALERPGFLAYLDQRIQKEVGEKWTNESTANIEADIEDIKARVEFLEESGTDKSYGPLKEGNRDSLKEKEDGDNPK